jgi:cytochrome c peroxidase
MMLAAVVARGVAPPDGDDHSLFTRLELAAVYRHSPLRALAPGTSESAADDARATRFGQHLFFERRFSADGAISCATCHAPEKAFADGRRVGKGLATGERNTPTLLNAAFSHWFFWDGRTDSLWAQALGPIENEKEFGGDRLHAVHVVAEDPTQRRAYEQVFGMLPPLEDARRFPRHAFPDPNIGSPAAVAWAAMAPADRDAVNRMFANLGKAIEAYERKLVNGDSPFDHYVAALKSGDLARQRAYPAPAKRGLKLFVGAAQCELCHSGPTFSDEEFHNNGLPLLAGSAPDTGRAAGIPVVLASIFNGIGPFSDQPTGETKDRLTYLPPPQSQLGAFKTPGLRNVALTAPYMHDGRFKNLEAVLAFYANGEEDGRGQTLVGKREGTMSLIPQLTHAQVADLVAFLKTLTGVAVPSELTKPPDTP